MRLIKYNYGYREKFNCCIHGRIVLTESEWARALKYLFHHSVQSYYLYKDILREDIHRFYETKKGRIYNVRVTATELIVAKFGIEKYKTGNYEFLVTPDLRPGR